MIVIERVDGELQTRAAFIGYIKNDRIRRILMAVTYPFVIVATIIINNVVAIFLIIAILIKATFVPLKGLFNPIWKDPVWKAARVKKHG